MKRASRGRGGILKGVGVLRSPAPFKEISPLSATVFSDWSRIPCGEGRRGVRSRLPLESTSPLPPALTHGGLHERPSTCRRRRRRHHGRQRRLPPGRHGGE